MLTRAELCTLADLDLEAFKPMGRRGQLPFPINERGRGEYALIDALATALMLRLAGSPNGHAMKLSTAAHRVRDAYELINHKLGEIAVTSEVRRKSTDADDVFVASVCLPLGERLAESDREGGWQPIVGTRQVISMNLKHVPLIDLVMTNATIAAVLMRGRAARADPGIDIDFGLR